MADVVKCSFDFDQQKAFTISDADAAGIPLSSIELIENVVSSEQEELVTVDIDVHRWHPSVSGVQKQEYGPRIDFEKKTICMEDCTGLPRYSRQLLTGVRKLSGQKSKSLEIFQPGRQRNLEYCASHDAPPEVHWETSRYHDHSWVFTDLTVVTCLLSEICVCLDMVKDGKKISVRIPMNPRSSLVIEGEATHAQINVDMSMFLTRCILIIYNQVKPGAIPDRKPVAGKTTRDLPKVCFFDEMFVGMPVEDFADIRARYLKKQDECPMPLFLNRFAEQHLPIDMVVSVLESQYGLKSSSHRILDGMFDTNIEVELDGTPAEKVWAKLVVDCIYFNERSLKAALKFRKWLVENKSMAIPALILPRKNNDASQSDSISIIDDLFVEIERSRIHYLWLLEYSELPRLSGRTLLKTDLKEVMSRLGATIATFHQLGSEYPCEEFENEVDTLHYYSYQSIDQDAEIYRKKVFLVDGEERRKLVLCCLRLMQDTVKVQKQASPVYPKKEVQDKSLDGQRCPLGLIHTAFRLENLTDLKHPAGNFESNYGVEHLAHVRFGILLTDIVLAAFRICHFNLKNTPPTCFVEYVSYMLAGYGRALRDSEKHLFYPLLMGMGSICLIEESEQHMLTLRGHPEKSDKIQETVDNGFELLEYLCSDENVESQINELLSKMA